MQAQLLDQPRSGQPRPGSVLEVVRHLTMLQVEPTAAVAPSADVVLWSRLGSAYDPAELEELVASQQLIDLDQRLRPREDLALFRAEMRHWPGRPPLKDWQERTLAWVEANEACRIDVLETLRQDGPLPLSALPDTCAVPWRSSGWNNAKNVKMLVGLMVERGEVARAGREGREVLWDLAERVYPDDPVPDLESALRERAERRLRALGLARPRAPVTPGEPNDVGEAGEPAVIEGVPGRWRVDPTLLDRPFAGRVALLSPLDRLVFDRKRMTELFEFDYQLEMYKPAAQRRWGYWAMPVLVRDRLVGKLDATADRAEGELRIDALHEDEPLDADRDAVEAEVDDLARWLGLEPVWL